MERRKAFATAGAVSVTALAVVVALGANVGLFGLTRHDDSPGQFKLVGSTQQSPAPHIHTEIVDVPVPVPGSPPAASSSRSAVPAADTSVAPPPAASSGGSEAPHGEYEPGESDGEDD